jgi:uncharacterized protein involved in exopolysaccharide biosynthesis
MLNLYYRDTLVQDVDQVNRDAASQQINFAPTTKGLLRQWRMIAFVTGVCLAGAAAYAALAPRQYNATALISIDTKGDTIIRTAPVPPDFNAQSANVDGQVEILQSEQLVRRVAEAVGKDAALSAALDIRGSPFEMLLPLRQFLPWPPTAEQSVQDETAQRSLALERHISVKRVGLTQLIEVSATMPSAQAAAQVANLYARAYIDDQLQRREESARGTSKMLQERVDELEQKAQEAQQAVEQLKYSGSEQGENSASARVKLQTLESTAQTYRVLHDKFLERYAETWQQQFLSVPDAQIASEAYPPNGKSAPKTLMILAAALLIGVSLGSVLALLRDRAKALKVA